MLPTEISPSVPIRERDTPASRGEIDSFLKTWLFFGLINEILGYRLSAQDLVRHIEIAGVSTKVLSSSAVPDATEQWVKDVKDKRIKPMPEYDHIARCLRLTFTNLKRAPTDIDQDLEISLASLGEMFCFAANSAFEVEDLVNDNRCPNQWQALINSDYGIDRMTSNGWCRSQIKLIRDSSMHIHTLYFAAHMTQSRTVGKHDNWDEDFCSAYQNNLRDYESRHVDSDCSCNYLSVEHNTLFEILSNSHLPLLRINGGPLLEDISLTVVSTKDFPKYLALSHVWADGLGNYRKNALPSCQLRFLRDKVQELKSSLGFPDDQELLLWCDTMCCPAEAGHGKKLAILKLKETYMEASYVLVLDSSLRSFALEKDDIHEAGIRITTSGWVRRLWTLQEGALALKDARLWFLFRDSALRIRTLVQGLRSRLCSLRGFEDDVNQRLVELFAFYSPDPTALSTNFQLVADALRFRSVSVKTDEPILMGNLLNLPVAQIIEHSEPQRQMQVLWSLIASVPHMIPGSIIFWVGQRLDLPGFRWAPASLLHPPSINFPLGLISADPRTGIPKNRGLLVKFPGYSVALPSRPRLLQIIAQGRLMQRETDFFWMRRNDGTWFMLMSRLSEDSPGFLPGKKLCSVMLESNLRLVHMPLDEAREEYEEEGTSDSAFGLLVKEVETKDHVRYVVSLMHVLFCTVLRT